ncbi:hypothetical protein HK101_006200, partial [Irineochytrium annulatum]
MSADTELLIKALDQLLLDTTDYDPRSSFASSRHQIAIRPRPPRRTSSRSQATLPIRRSTASSPASSLTSSPSYSPTPTLSSSSSSGSPSTLVFVPRDALDLVRRSVDLHIDRVSLKGRARAFSFEVQDDSSRRFSCESIAESISSTVTAASPPDVPPDVPPKDEVDNEERPTLHELLRP